MLSNFIQSVKTDNGLARRYALENTVELTNLIPPTVSYESGGQTLIIGPTAIIESTALQLDAVSGLTLLSTDGEVGKSDRLYYAEGVQVSGFLGAFSVQILQGQSFHNLAKVAIGQDCFDIVLDLCLDSCIDDEIAAPGYYPVGRGHPKLADALEAIPNLMGTFDKPKYFRLDPDLCAHSSRGIKGCERCVSACPAGALTSSGSEQTGHKIEINPYLCQGIGTCATACPTEAISYALPEAEKTQQFMEKLLSNYRAAGGQDAVVLFCSADHERHTLKYLQQCPDNVIPVSLDELSSTGMDTWLAALVNGAHQVLFLVSQHMPKTVLKVLTSEVEMAQTLLSQLGIGHHAIDLVYLEEVGETEPCWHQLEHPIIIGKLHGNKRQRGMQALEALSRHYVPHSAIAPLNEGAPFGKIECESSDCTLCMSCVSVCPTRALHTLGESPTLSFIEEDCIQCGMCLKACPENALSATSQFNWDASQRKSAVTLHEEEAQKCTRCHKPFAPKSMITMLQDKLRGHSHFVEQSAFERLSMCEDCRVVDMFEALNQDPSKQLEI